MYTTAKMTVVVIPLMNGRQCHVLAILICKISPVETRKIGHKFGAQRSQMIFLEHVQHTDSLLRNVTVEQKTRHSLMANVIVVTTCVITYVMTKL